MCIQSIPRQQLQRVFFVLAFSIFAAASAIAQPTSQASNILIRPVSGQTGQLNFSFTAGTGGVGRIVIVTNATGSFVPGTPSPTAVGAFPADAAPSDLDPSVGGIAVCVMNSGLTATANISGFVQDNTYTVRVYEYSGSAAVPNYSLVQAPNNPLTFRYFTATNTWTRPSVEIATVTAQAWGAGGTGGGNSTNDDGGGGGGGGAYSAGTATVGASESVTVGTSVAGTTGTPASHGEPSWFKSITTVFAEGGRRGAAPVAGAGGLGGNGGNLANGFGNIELRSGGNGGAGRDNSNGRGGGGGSSAAPGTNGVNGGDGGGGGATGGVLPGGGGGNGADASGSGNQNGDPGFTPGGGGSGSGDTNVSGGQGANGLVVVSFYKPANFTVGAVTAVGGNVLANKWNNTNTSLNVTVPVENNSTLTGGTIQIMIDNGTTPFIALGTAHTILVGELGTNVVVSIPEATLEGSARYANGSTLVFTAQIALSNGNYTQGTQSANSIVVNTTPPTAPSIPDLEASTDTGTLNNDNITNDVTPDFTTTGTAGLLLEILDGTTVVATIASATGAPQTVTTSTLSAGTRSITARTTNADGNVASSAALNVTIDITAPGAPSAPTAAAGPVINIAENGSFSIVVPGLGGAVTNEIVKLYVNAVLLTSHTFAAAPGATYTFTNVTLPGVSGSKDVTATLTDLAGNESLASGQLSLTLDIDPPPIPLAPTAAAGPTIDGAEYTAGFAVNVAGLGSAGVGDVLELLLGGSPFPSPLTNTLDAGEIAAGNVNFTVICNQLGNDGAGKLISARLTDVNGNPGTASPNLSLTLSTEPTAASTALNFTGVTTTQATVNFTSGAGTGTGRIIVARQGGAVTFVPVDNTNYPANNDFAAAADLGSGNKVVGTGSGNTITNLPSGDVVHFAIFEYNNCATRENYFATALTGNQAIAAGTASTIGTGAGAVTIASTIDTQAEAAAAAANLSFIVDDDGATNGADAAPTRITSMTIRRDLVNDQTGDWTDVIGGVVLTDGTASMNSVTNFADFSITPNAITITNIPSALVADLGYVGDNTTKTMQVKIWLKTNITALDIDNKRFVFTADVADFAVAVTNSSGFAASTVTSGAGNGQVTVTADRLAFSTIPAGGTAGTGFPLAIAATDVNGNVDLNQTALATITAPTFPASGQIIFTYATPSTAAQNMVAGRTSWTNVKVTAGGNYTFRVSAPGLTMFTSGIITFAAPSNTSSVSTSGTFIAPITIDYTQFQHASLFTLASPPPAGSIEVARFLIEDGAGGIDPDEIGTTLTNLTFNVTTPGNLRFIGISDGTNIVATAAGGPVINLSGMSLLAEDVDVGGTGFRTFSVFASFDANVVDNQNFQMTITSVSTGNGGSTFALPNGGGATSSPAGNVVIVNADRLNIAQNPPASVLIGIPISPAVTVEAVDILGSRDLDQNFVVVGLNSNGSMITVPTATLINGFGTYSNITHDQTATARTLTTTNGSGWINDASTNFDLNASNNSDIISNLGFGYPTNINYASFQAPNINLINSVPVAQFDVRDGGGTDLDGAPTNLTALGFSVVNSSFIRSAALYDEFNNELSEVAPSGGNVAFSGFNFSVGDNGSRTLTIRVTFNTAVTDNQQFSFTVNSVTTQPLISSTFPTPGAATSSIAGDNNRIEVIADRLAFTTNFSSPLLPVKNIVLQQTPPVVEARDIFNNRDRDYGINVTISCLLSVFPSITLVADNAVPNSGVFTFPNNFQYLQTGNGTITVSSGGLLNAISNAVTVQAGQATTISAGTASPATISSLVTTAGGAVAAFNFNVNDDPVGTLANNDDGLPTLISQIIIRQNLTNNTITDWTQAIAGAILTDGTNNLDATAISANSITFGGISTAAGQLGFVGDNLTKNYSVRIYLRTSLGGTLPADIDGRKFEFQVTQGPDITLSTNSTGIIAAQTHTSGNANVVDVTATTLRFTNPTVPTTVSLDTDYPGVSVEAVDIHNNRDLGYTQLVREVSNPASAGMSNQPTVGSTPFVAGVLNFASNFRYTSGASGANVTLTVKAGANTSCGGGVNLCATSSLLTLLSSFESIVIGDPTYTYSANLPYVQHQEASNIQETPSSREIARMLLFDGSRVNYNYGGFLITTGTNVDAIANGDEDGAETRLNSITINITNPATLRRIALYSGSTELGEINVDALNIPDGTPNQDFTFTGAPLLIAPDNNTSLLPAPLSLRASFLSTAPEITDGDLITVRVANAVLASGSNFFNSPPYIAGVNGGYQSPGGFNRLNVTATKLDFVTQPDAFAGKNEPVVGAAVVHARDQFNVLDTDFNTLPSPSIVTSQGAANVLGSFAFTGGILNMNGLITYGNPGIGTLTVNAGGLSSLTNLPAATPPNVAVQCTPVNVIHVGTVRQDGGPGGVPNGGPLDQVSLLAGSQDQVLFGFTFNAPHTVTGPNHPRVTRFTFSFNNSISGIFNNIRVFESTTGQFSVATQVPGANITPGTQTIVDFTATPKDLTLLPNLTYFIMADVDPAVSGTTPNMKVSIIDGGVGSPTQNNIQVVSNIGSQLANTSGPTFNFAAVAPPTLVDTYPRIGQTNLDPTQPTLEMTFSVAVYTLDQQVRLYRKGISPAPDVLVATLAAANGFPFLPSGVGAAKPIIFNIPPGTLAADNEYYVLISPGNLSTNTGICDASRNLFPGIGYPGTFFFRTASPVAPRLLGSGTVPAASAGDPIATDVTNDGATINSTFDKLGKAYYIICSTNNPTPPTNLEVISGIYPANTVVASGQFDIGATHTISQFGNFSVPGGFTAGTHYVWITAESFAEKKVGGVISQTGFLATSPYGSTAFDFGPIGGPVTGPTFSFPAPGASPTPVVTTNNVTISMCSNSFQVLNTPIIIYEGTNPGQTFTSATPDQTFNIVLPAGFQFDDSEISPGVPAYGKVDLIGADFGGIPGVISYLSTSVLRITFTNFGGFGSKDQIVLRNLRIRSDGSRVGNIFRLGGTGIPAINDGAIIARLSAQEAPIISFDNSYSLSLGESWAGTSFSETAIPDNAVPSLVTLTPYIPNAFDFGPTTFEGQGVNINTLNVKGVTLDVPFNITVTHTDQNGCISDSPVQFVVYDDARAIVITRPGLVNVPPTIPINLNQGPYCSAIPTFQIGQQLPSPATPGVVRDVFFDNLDAYYMETLVAGIPATSVAGTHIINSTDFGGEWINIVAGLPQVVGTQNINGYDFRDYQFDDKRIVNASAISGGIIPYVYDNFDVSKTPSTPGNYAGNITYYNGGSLGFVEFTGTFRNIANPIVKINRRQIVEFYVPAVPAIEFVTPYSDLITTDPANPPSVGSNPNNLNNPGTFVFCQAGGLITVNGWPKAEPTQGTQGIFRIYNAAVGGTQIMTGLTDFGTGIAQINPADPGIQNGNNNIRIEYEYRDANSTNGTCTSIGSQVFRISPNPTASFTQVSLASPFVDATNPTAYCEGKPIRFDPSASSVSGGGAVIETYTWLFDDATNSISANPNAVSGLAGNLAVPGDALAIPPILPVPAAGTNDFPVHYYKDFNTYNPTLVITSNFNCQSVPATQPVKVGGIPEVKMVFDGTHAGPAAADAFHFQSNNSLISSNDHFKRLDVDFGDGITDFFTLSPSTLNDPLFNANIFDHNYTTTGQKVFDFRITTEIGCVNSLSLDNTLIKGISAAEDVILRTLIVLPRFIVTPTSAYLETFEPATFDPNQIWQAWYTGSFTPTPLPPAITPIRSVDPSWELGVPVGKFTPTINGTTIWTTRLSGTYTSGERSAIYSPSLDLSALTRPMISFDTWTHLEPADGVVLQYSIDNKNITDPTKVWKVLGTENDGEFWYTDRGIAAKPGDQIGNDYGWSQKIRNEWLSSRHALVDDGTSLIITDPRVVFRLALGSAATNISGDGFGFDNVRIGERTRTILLESFGNSANTTKSPTTPAANASDEQYESEVIAGFNAALVGLEVVKLNYRVNFPGNDPLNMNNPGDPSSRALFYNVDKTPAARLDGYAPTPYTPFSDWGVNAFNTRTLRLAQAAIVIRPDTGPPSNISSSGKIKFFVDVTPTVDLDSKTILHLGVVEQVVPLASLSTNAQNMIETGENSFEYVVKKLIPSASGTRTSSHPNAVGGVLVAPPAPATTTYTFGPFEWTPELNKFYAPSTGDLGVIAFLQREDGDKEVYQAEIVLSLDDPPSSLVTGVEPISAENIKVYPNPANQDMTVLLPAQVAKAATLQLIDQTGRTALMSTIPEGADRKTLDVRDLSSGVYILTVDMGSGVLTRKKVVVVHQE